MKKQILLVFGILFSISSHAQSPAWGWAVNAGGSNSDESKAIATDKLGNVIITGTFISATMPFGSVSISKPDLPHDVFIAKYSPTGSTLWAKRIGGAAYDYGGNGVATDAQNNIITVGS